MVSALNPLYVPTVGAPSISQGDSLLNIYSYFQELEHALRLSKPTHILVEKALLHNLVTALTMEPQLPQKPILHVWDADQGEPGIAEVLRTESIIQNGSADFEPLKLPAGAAAKQLAFICFSSGTSGLVKGVRLSHGNVVSNIFQQSQALRGMFTAKTVVALIVPFFHILGLAGFSCQYVSQVSRSLSVLILSSTFKETHHSNEQLYQHVSQKYFNIACGTGRANCCFSEIRFSSLAGCGKETPE